MDSMNVNPNQLHEYYCQGGSSSLFHFLCGLSPIKPSSRAGIVSYSQITAAAAYAELSSPPPVFRSPAPTAIAKSVFAHAHTPRLPLTNESASGNQDLAHDSECSSTSPDAPLAIAPRVTSASMRHHEEGGEEEREEAQAEEEGEEEDDDEGSEARGAKEGGHNRSRLRPIHSPKIVRPFEEDDDDVEEGCCDTEPDFFFGNSSSFGFQNESKGFVPSCSDSPSEQLSKILASLRGQMVEERARKQLDFDLGSLIMDNSSQNREFNDQSNPQACRAAMVGIRRRCLDFEATGIGNGSSSDWQAPATHDLPSSRSTLSQDHSLPLLSQCTSNEDQGIAPRNDSSYLSLPLTTHLPTTSSHESMLPLTAIIEKSMMDGLIDSSSTSGDTNLGRALSLMERITLNHQDSKSLSTTSPYAGIATQSSTMAFDIDTIESLLNATDLVNGLLPGHGTGNDQAVRGQDVSQQLESDLADESSQYTPRSPRKKRKLSIQEEGCKNCKCKKSKCLKLYCECFAAGVYCIGSCNCNGCLNKPEFKDIVLGKRQQIESRNPLAFVPKIIRVCERISPIVGEEGIETPESLARHKKGCNCKKSQCSKKYCECYQAGVGCGDGCRCEGCTNLFGRKHESGSRTEKDQPTTSLEASSTNEEVTLMDSRATPEHRNGVFSPITPYLDNSHEQCKSSVESRLNEEKSSQSPFSLPSLPTMPDFNSPCRLLESLERVENLGQLHLDSHPNLAGLHSKLTEITDITDPCGSQSLNNSYSLYKPLPQILSGSSAFPSNYQYNSAHDKGALPMPSTPHTLPNSFLSRCNYDSEDMSTTPVQSVNWLSDEENNPNVLNQSNNHSNSSPDHQGSGYKVVMYESNNFCASRVVLKTRSPQQKRVLSYPRNSIWRDIDSPADAGHKAGSKAYMFLHHHQHQQDVMR